MVVVAGTVVVVVAGAVVVVVSGAVVVVTGAVVVVAAVVDVDPVGTAVVLVGAVDGGDDEVVGAATVVVGAAVGPVGVGPCEVGGGAEVVADVAAGGREVGATALAGSPLGPGAGDVPPGTGVAPPSSVVELDVVAACVDGGPGAAMALATTTVAGSSGRLMAATMPTQPKALSAPAARRSIRAGCRLRFTPLSIGSVCTEVEPEGLFRVCHTSPRSTRGWVSRLHRLAT